MRCRQTTPSIKAAVAEVLSRKDCSGGRWQNSFTAHALRRRSAAAGARARMTGRVCQDAQCAAWRSALAQRRPSPPNRWEWLHGRPGDSTGSKLQQAGEALGDGRVMGNRVVLGEKVSRLAALNQVLQHLVPAWGDWRPLAWATIALTARRSKPISRVVGWPGGYAFATAAYSRPARSTRTRKRGTAAALVPVSAAAASFDVASSCGSRCVPTVDTYLSSTPCPPLAWTA